MGLKGIDFYNDYYNISVGSSTKKVWWIILNGDITHEVGSKADVEAVVYSIAPVIQEEELELAA